MATTLYKRGDHKLFVEIKADDSYGLQQEADVEIKIRVPFSATRVPLTTDGLNLFDLVQRAAAAFLPPVVSEDDAERDAEEQRITDAVNDHETGAPLVGASS